MPTRWGMTVPLGMPLAEHAAVFAGLADAGFTDVWSSEVAGADAFTPLALAAAWEPRLRLGTAVAPVFTRGPGLLAMTAAALAETAPGRFQLGIGASSPVVVGDWNAAEFTEPYQRSRDMLRFLRAALAGETVDEDYDTFAVRRFRLEPPRRRHPPLPAGGAGGRDGRGGLPPLRCTRFPPGPPARDTAADPARGAPAGDVAAGRGGGRRRDPELALRGGRAHRPGRD